MTTKEQLVDAAIGGDRGALEELLRQIGPIVWREINHKIDARHGGLVDADDVMQVTYIEAFLRIGRFVPAGNGAFLAWLRRMAANNLVDAIRREKPERRIAAPASGRDPTGDPATTLFRGLTATTATASRQLSEQEACAAVRAALKTLPPDYARVLELLELEGKTGPEAAQIMGRRHGAIRMLRARARELLAERLGTFSHYL